MYFSLLPVLLSSFSSKVWQCTDPLLCLPCWNTHSTRPCQYCNEHVPTPNPSSCVVLTGLSLCSVTCTLSSGTQCRLRQTLAKASACHRTSIKGMHREPFWQLRRGPLSACSSPASLRKLYKVWFLLHLSSCSNHVATPKDFCRQPWFLVDNRGHFEHKKDLHRRLWRVKADEGTRTLDPRFTKALLYQLSYIGLYVCRLSGLR